ncbi:sodium/potassium/calcium exchanger 4-like [Melitaea cinxia]|uniref:sodium/potassium/calcium exchanger 4-like n=1 Tax=Melitaea cinxia TaxID=113334 RepID=UPI001E270B5C|nr:sodium/potassium/calcium exchanger 4-like [Melitaea cinxia]
MLLYKLAAVTIVTICLSSSYVATLEDFNVTDSFDEYMTIVNDDGQEVLITKELMKKLNEEAETWHWRPWLKTKTVVVGNIIQEVKRPSGDSVRTFPAGIFDDHELRSGAVALYCLFGICAFTFIAIVCNDYFIPCVELICEDLKIPQNVAAATFMSVATSCPEFFVNVISTFLTRSDMGIGTIVGSSIFNLLGVAAVGSLAANAPIAIEPRPVTRDVLIYMVNVGALVAIVWNGEIVWYEAMILGILYILYFIIMFNSVRIFALIDLIEKACCQRKSRGKYTVNTDEKPIEEGIDNKGFVDNVQTNNVTSNEKQSSEKTELEEKPKKSFFRFPKEKSVIYKIWWVYTWPLKFILRSTIPSPVTCRRYYPLAFLLCIVWIGANSYIVTWSITVIGHTFFIPESIMGMTVLAFGGCLPEACSIFIMSRKGQGGIGVSNALGANSLSILFALGLPWLIKTLMLLVQGVDTAVTINSEGIDFIVSSLLVAACLLWISLFMAKFKLRRSLGVVLFGLYLIFITFAILVEMGIILDETVHF